jgi:hypothetical protein
MTPPRRRRRHRTAACGGLLSWRRSAPTSSSALYLPVRRSSGLKLSSRNASFSGLRYAGLSRNDVPARRGGGGIASRPISLATMQGLLPPCSGGARRESAGEEAVVSAAAVCAQRRRRRKPSAGPEGAAIHSVGGGSRGWGGVEGSCLLGFEWNWRWSESRGRTQRRWKKRSTDCIQRFVGGHSV